MNWLHTTLLLLAAFLAIFAQVVFDGVRRVLGVQVDLLPSLMVYASLMGTLSTVTLLAFAAGLMFDSLSANPLGISVLPLFVIGFLIQRYRGLILRDQPYAQVVLGLAASTGAPVLTLLLLINTDKPPLVGWHVLWQWLVMGLAGAVMTPLWFGVFGRALAALSYPPLTQITFRQDREIKRRRMVKP